MKEIDKSRYTLTETTVGYRLTFEGNTYYIGAQTDNGYCYKDEKAFRNRKGVCYICESQFLDEVGWDENIPDEIPLICEQEQVPIYGIGVYDELMQCGETYNDIMQSVVDAIDTDFCGQMTEQYGKLWQAFIEYLTQSTFDICDWQHTQSYTYADLDIDENWEYFKQEQQKKGE